MNIEICISYAVQDLTILNFNIYTNIRVKSYQYNFIFDVGIIAAYTEAKALIAENKIIGSVIIDLIIGQYT